MPRVVIQRRPPGSSGGGGFTPLAPAAYFNSRQAEGLSSESRCIGSDDLSRGFSVLADVEGRSQHSPDDNVFSGDYLDPAYIQYTAGLAHTIFYSGHLPTTSDLWVPQGMVGPGVADCTDWGGGAQRAFCHGALAAGANSQYMGSRDFSTQTKTFCWSLDRWFPADYIFPATKLGTIEPPSWGYNAGIEFFGLGCNIASSPDTQGVLGITMNWNDTLWNGLGTLQRNGVYNIQIAADKSGADGSHVLDVYFTPLGFRGGTINRAQSPNRVLHATGLTIKSVTGPGTYDFFGNRWAERWGEPIGSDQAAPGPQWTNDVVWNTMGPIPIRNN